MKLYAVILFVVVLNFSFGFIGTMLPWFLPDAADELQNNFKMDNAIETALDSFKTDTSQSAKDDNLGIEMLNNGLKILKTFFVFITSCITFLPELMENILNQIFAGVSEEDSNIDDLDGVYTATSWFKNILSWGLGILFGIAVIQLFTGKWLPFAE